MSKIERDWRKEYMDYRHVAEPAIGRARLHLRQNSPELAALALNDARNELNELDERARKAAPAAQQPSTAPDSTPANCGIATRKCSAEKPCCHHWVLRNDPIVPAAPAAQQPETAPHLKPWARRIRHLFVSPHKWDDPAFVSEARVAEELREFAAAIQPPAESGAREWLRGHYPNHAASSEGIDTLPAMLEAYAASLQARVRRADSDWLAIVKLIAKLSPVPLWSGEEEPWTDEQLLEAFDPWETLRGVQARVRAQRDEWEKSAHYVGKAVVTAEARAVAAEKQLADEKADHAATSELWAATTADKTAVEARAAALLTENGERDALVMRFVDDLLWAVDLIGMYDKRLVEKGDPKELVNSAIHLGRLSGARNLVEYAWQMLRENSDCSDCRAGNVPIEGWHSYGQFDVNPCRHLGSADAAHPPTGAQPEGDRK